MIAQKKIFLLDTETVGLPPKNYAYDIAWCVTTKKGEIISRQGYMVREIATQPDLMMGAFFAKKIFSDYIPALADRDIELLPFAEIVERMKKDAAGCTVVSAYNLPFDMRAIKATKTLLNSADNVFSARPDLLCLWDFACKYLFNSRLYHDVAQANGWVSDAGNVRTTAEHAYRFITGDFDFIEAHTASADVSIENQILAKLMSKKKKIPYNDITALPWRIAQEIN